MKEMKWRLLLLPALVVGLRAAVPAPVTAEEEMGLYDTLEYVCDKLKSLNEDRLLRMRDTERDSWRRQNEEIFDFSHSDCTQVKLTMSAPSKWREVEHMHFAGPREFVGTRRVKFERKHELVFSLADIQNIETAYVGRSRRLTLDTGGNRLIARKVFERPQEERLRRVLGSRWRHVSNSHADSVGFRIDRPQEERRIRNAFRHAVELCKQENPQEKDPFD